MLFIATKTVVTIYEIRRQLRQICLTVDKIKYKKNRRTKHVRRLLLVFTTLPLLYIGTYIHSIEQEIPFD